MLNILLGYNNRPGTTAAFMRRAFEARSEAETMFVGTSWSSQPGFSATGDLSTIIADMPVAPDLYLYIDADLHLYFPRGITQVNFPTACYLIDVHVGPKERLKQAMFFDYAFSAQRNFVDVLKRAGHPQAHWLPLACEPNVHHRFDVPKRYDVGFAGTLVAGYERRRTLLERLASRYTTNDYKRLYPPEEMSRIFSESRIIFNCSLRHEINMRVFEGPATGSLLLTDRIGNGLSDLFTDRRHMVMYDDDQLLDLAEEMLRDEPLRERIAQQGYELVHTKHTYKHRIDTILETIFSSTTQPRMDAPLRRRSDAEVQLAYAELMSRLSRVDDTIDAFKRLPKDRHYQLQGAKHVALSMIRKLKFG